MYFYLNLTESIPLCSGNPGKFYTSGITITLTVSQNLHSITRKWALLWTY
jgi:hypothetical protein